VTKVTRDDLVLEIKSIGTKIEEIENRLAYCSDGELKTLEKYGLLLKAAIDEDTTAAGDTSVGEGNAVVGELSLRGRNLKKIESAGDNPPAEDADLTQVQRIEKYRVLIIDCKIQQNKLYNLKDTLMREKLTKLHSQDRLERTMMEKRLIALESLEKDDKYNAGHFYNGEECETEDKLNCWDDGDSISRMNNQGLQFIRDAMFGSDGRAGLLKDIQDNSQKRLENLDKRSTNDEEKGILELTSDMLAFNQGQLETSYKEYVKYDDKWNSTSKCDDEDSAFDVDVECTDDGKDNKSPKEQY